ncbi:MAG: cobalamin B12-binding domain-containing protein [Hyphomicrobiales bacterium]
MTEIDRSRVDHPNTASTFVAPDISARSDAAERQARLAKVVARDIIPHLKLLHQQALPPDAHPSEDEISLAHLVLGPDVLAASEFVRGLRDRGLSMETLFVELLEPSARHLGSMWENDECDFIDVTLGVGRLQELLAIFNETHDVPTLVEKRRVLLATTPREQHVFGIAMLEKFFRAGGWQVDVSVRASVDDVVRLAHANWYAVLGLTLNCRSQIDDCRREIARIRAGSRNRSMRVLVGGAVFADAPELASAIGADATAVNGPTAVLASQKLLDAILDAS